MFPGLLVGAVLAVPSPGSVEAHKDALARFGVAVWNLRRDRLLTAAKLLEAAAKQDPDATAPLRELVRVYSQLGREPDAIRVAREVVRKDPHDVDTAHTLARLLFDLGELKEAVAAARLAADAPIPLGRADKAVAVYRDLATLCDKAGDAATAGIALRKAVELLVEKRKDVIAAAALTPREVDTATAECQERLGKILTKLGQYDDAATAFTAAAKYYADPRKGNDPGAAARLGWNMSAVAEAKGDRAAAIAHLEPFLKLQPVSVEPYARLAKLLRATGRDMDVVPVLRRYADADHKNLPLQAAFAAELVRQADTRPEGDALFAATAALTSDPQVIETMLRSYFSTARPGEVLAILDRTFATLKEKDSPTADTVEAAAARTLAAERVRVIGDFLRADATATAVVLRLAIDDIRLGTRRQFQTHYFLGRLAARHRKLELAALQFRQAIRVAPPKTQSDAYSGLLNVLWLARKPAEVAAVCREGLQNPDLNAGYFNSYLAAALAALGDADGALAAVDLAVKQNGDGIRSRLEKVEVLRALGKWDDSIALGKKLFDEATTATDRLAVRYELSLAYSGASKHEEAEAELRAILDADPDHAGACNNLGYYLADQGRELPEAERLVRHAIAVDRLDRRKSGAAEPESAAYVDSLGWVLFRRGKLAEARVELERAAAMTDGAADATVWDHLGDVLFRLGEKAKAKAAWEKAVEIHESDARPRDGRLDEVKRKLKRVP